MRSDPSHDPNVMRALRERLVRFGKYAHGRNLGVEGSLTALALTALSFAHHFEMGPRYIWSASFSNLRNCLRNVNRALQSEERAPPIDGDAMLRAAHTFYEHVKDVLDAAETAGVKDELFYRLQQAVDAYENDVYPMAKEVAAHDAA